MYVVFDYNASSLDFLAQYKNIFSVIKKNYATINKFQVNHHRNFKLNHRIT